MTATAHIREAFSKCSARSSEVTSNWLLVAALLCHLFYSFVLYVKTGLWMNCLEWLRKKEEKEQNRWKVIGLRIHRMEKWWRLEDENGEGSWKKEKENRREKTERSEARRIVYKKEPDWKREQEDLLAHSSITLPPPYWSVYISASADVINRAD